MKTELGSFEGREVDAAVLSLSGKADTHVDVLDMEETVYALIKGSVTRISHGELTARGTSMFVRDQKVKASTVIILSRDKGEQMMTEASLMADDRFGVDNLFAQADAVLSDKGKLPPGD